MKILSDLEIGRTAFPWRDPSSFTSDFGLLNPEKDPNEMCICCKSESTQVQRDKVLLEPFDKFYSNCNIKDYKVIECQACGYVFSNYKKEVL